MRKHGRFFLQAFVLASFLLCAFDECITDLSWLEADGYALLIYNPESFQECDPAEMATARAIFEDAAGYWKNQDKRFFVGLAAGSPPSERTWRPISP